MVERLSDNTQHDTGGEVGMDKELLKEILEVLVHCIGDHRRCPNCGYGFIPDDLAQYDAVNLMKKLKDMKPHG